VTLDAVGAMLEIARSIERDELATSAHRRRQQMCIGDLPISGFPEVGDEDDRPPLSAAAGGALPSVGPTPSSPRSNTLSTGTDHTRSVLVLPAIVCYQLVSN
jgi:hypothetical protein